MAKGGACLELDHYLEGLLRKAGTLPAATALEQARAAGKFTPIHDVVGHGPQSHGDQHGTRALVEVCSCPAIFHTNSSSLAWPLPCNRAP